MSKSFINMETGEVVGSNLHVRLMLDDIGRLFELSKFERNLLDLILRDCKYGNEINITPKKRGEYAKELYNISDPKDVVKKKRSVSVFISNLIKKNILKRPYPDDNPYMVIIDPKIAFKGGEYNQAIIMSIYEYGKRDVIVITNKDNIEDIKDVLKNRTN